jgi:hypothetical protein
MRIEVGEKGVGRKYVVAPAVVDEEVENVIVALPVPLTNVRVPDAAGAPVPTVTKEVPLVKAVMHVYICPLLA